MHAVDNCAGGGRRIDLETLSRSVPLWRSDSGSIWGCESLQLMSMGIADFVPVSAGATCGHGAVGALQPYAWRSSGAAGKDISWGPSTWEQIANNTDLIAVARAAVSETRRIRDRAIEGDYYPLSEVSLAMNVSAIYQFHRRDQSDGFAMVFRRPNATTELTLRLQGLDAQRYYSVSFYRNYSLDRRETLSGAAMFAGLVLSMPGVGGGESLLVEYALATRSSKTDDDAVGTWTLSTALLNLSFDNRGTVTGLIDRTSGRDVLAAGSASTLLTVSFPPRLCPIGHMGASTLVHSGLICATEV